MRGKSYTGSGINANPPQHRARRASERTWPLWAQNKNWERYRETEQSQVDLEEWRRGDQRLAGYPQFRLGGEHGAGRLGCADCRPAARPRGLSNGSNHVTG